MYDKQTNTLHESQLDLPAKRKNAHGQTVTGLHTTKDTGLLSTVGIIPHVTDQIAVGMVASGGYTVEVIDDVAHKIMNVITEAEHATAEATRKEASDNLFAAVETSKAIFKVFANEINKLRTQAGGSAFTAQEWRDKLKAEM